MQYDRKRIETLIAGLPRELTYTDERFGGSVGAASLQNRASSYNLHAERICMRALEVIELHQCATKSGGLGTEDRVILDGRIGEVIKALLVVVRYGDTTNGLVGDTESCRLITLARFYLEDPLAAHP